MSTSVPTATYIVESTVIQAPLSQVWHQIKLEDFSKWYSALKSSSATKGTSPEADVFTWVFNDLTSYEVKMEEWSAINHSITYSIVAAEPATSFSSILSKIELKPVTTGPSEGSTYVSWSAQFSSDADAGVIEDARFKRKEALADLAKAVAKK